MNEVWAAVEPYVMAFAQTGIGTALVYLICRLCVSKWFRKNDVNSLVNGVASRLAGSTINVDLTAVAERKLGEIEKELKGELKPLVETLEQVRHLVALVGQALSRSRTLTEAERSALVAAVQGVEDVLTPVEKEEPITVTVSDGGAEVPASKRVRMTSMG